MVSFFCAEIRVNTLKFRNFFKKVQYSACIFQKTVYISYIINDRVCIAQLVRAPR